MYRNDVRVESPVRAAGIAVIPVVRVYANCWQGSHGLSFMGGKQPAAVVVVTASARKAFRATGEEVSLEQLIGEVPQVKEVMAGL